MEYCGLPMFFPRETKNGFAFEFFSKDTSSSDHTPVIFSRLVKKHGAFLERLTERRRTKKEVICEDVLLQELHQYQGLKSDERVFRSEGVSSIDFLRVRFKAGQHLNAEQIIIDSGREEEVLRTKELGRSNHSFLDTLAIRLETDVPVRTMKIRTQFRRGMLKHIKDALKRLHDMNLFKCNECKSRFPT